VKIAIIGTRGIPNYYGGFEQFAEYLSVGLVERGFEVVVYNSHSHPYKEFTYKGVEIVHCWDPEDLIGTAGQFIYDLNCILDSRKKNFDVILQLGYTSSSIWSRLFPKKAIVTTNMDGLEWKRTKYSKKVQRFLRYAEKLAIKHSDHLIADSIGIQKYLSDTFNSKSVYIPYGSDLFQSADEKALADWDFAPYGYDMLIARLEPENSIEKILKGACNPSSGRPFLVIGNHDTNYGAYLKKTFENCSNIRFVGGIYDQQLLNNLRHYSNLYFHGHTVGGTNPSLLEAMACSALICASDNVFNRAILGNDAFYFNNSDDITELVINLKRQEYAGYIERNIQKIESTYSWSKVVQQYVDHFKQITNKLSS